MGVGPCAPGGVAVGGVVLEAVPVMGEERAALGLLAPRVSFAFRDVSGVERALKDLLGVLTLMKVHISMVVV